MTTPALPITDPFSRVEEFIWELIEAHPATQALVPVNNRIKHIGGGMEPRKQSELDADMCSLEVVPLGFTNRSTGSSNHNGIQYRWGVRAKTGDLRTAGDSFNRAGLHQIEWALVRAFYKRLGRPDHLDFVSRVWLDTAAASIEERSESSARDGWVTVCEIVADMHFHNVTEMQA